MANTFTTFTGNGSNLDSGTIPFERFAETEIKVEVNDIAVNNYTIVGATTTQTAGAYSNISGGVIRFNNNSPNSDVCESSGAPKNGLLVLIYRSTDGDSNKYTFQAGSSIKADHLNQTLTQIRRLAYERQNQYIRHSQIGDKAVESVNIKDDTIVNADINSSAGIVPSKLGSGALPSGVTVASANIVDGTISPDDLGTNSVTTVKILDNNVTDAKISAVSSSKLTGALPALDGSNLTGVILGDTTVTAAKLHGDLLVTAAEQAAHTANDTSILTTAAGNARYYGLGSVEEIQSGETWAAADNKVATTAAIDARVIDLVDDVGGFWPIANETSFPNANPDVNNGAGTIVSIKSLASALTSNGSGVATIANGNVANNATITINGLANSTTYGAGIGMLVETTSTLHTYTFHRQAPDATSTTTVAGSITNVNTVAGNISNVNTVAGVSGNVTTVAGISANTTTVAGISANVTTVAGIASNVTTVAGDAADIGAVAGKATEIGRLGTTDAVADMNTLGTSSNVTNMDTVAGAITNVNNVGGSIANVNTVGSNIGTVNDFAARYRVAGSAPGSDNDEGDLYFNTSSNELQVYNGSAWQGGVTATGNLVSTAGSTMTGDLVMDNQADVRFEEATANGSNYIALQAPAAIASNVTLTLPNADGSNGQTLTTDGSGNLTWASGGSDKMPLAGGSFTGDVLIDNQNDLRFGEADGNGTNYVAFQAPNAIASNVTWTLPNADGSNGQFLKTDGSGALTWTTQSTTDSTKLPLAGGTLTGNVIIDNAQELRFEEQSGNGNNYVGFEAPAALSGDQIWVLPSADGSANQVIKTDGSGALGWADQASGATGGSTDEVFVENARTVTTSYTITSTKNAHTVGPIALNSGATITVPANSLWYVH